MPQNYLLLYQIIVVHVSIGIFLSRIYPNERADNFFIYEQFLITVFWIVLNNFIFCLQDVYDGQKHLNFKLVLILSEALQVIFELTVPIYAIHQYGYPDVTVILSPQNNTISTLGEPNETIETS